MPCKGMAEATQKSSLYAARSRQRRDFSGKCIRYDVLKNKTFILIFLVTFTFISIIAIWPDSGKEHNVGFTSAELKLQEKTVNDSTDSTLTTCSSVNAEGETTVAINRDYAVMEQLKNVKGQVIEERYFDADGNPVKLYDSYCGIKNEYHDHEVALR